MAFPGWVRSFGIGIGGVALLVALFYAEEDWRGAREWAQVEKELRAKGEPLTWKEILPPPVPADRNVAAAPIFAELFAAKEGGPRLDQFKRVFARKSGESLPPLRLLGSSKEPDLAAWQRRLTGEATSAPATDLGRYLKAYDPLLEEVSEALRRPAVRWLSMESTRPFDEPHPYLTPVLYLCRFLQLRSIVEIEAGQPDAALDDIDLGFRLADILDRGGGVLIDYAVETGSETLLWGAVAYGLEKRTWNADQLRRLQSILDGPRPLKSLQGACRRERCGCLQIFLLSPQEQRKVLWSGFNSGFEEVSWKERLAVRVYRLRPAGWIDLDRASFARRAQSERIESIDAERGTGNITRLLWPGEPSLGEALVRPGSVPGPHFLAILRKGWMTQAYANEARVACAIELWRLEHGEIPDSLEAMVPDFLSSLPPDPVTSGLLHYVRKEEGYLIYSVGTDGKDDGGAVDSNDKDHGDWTWASRPALYKFLPEKAP